MTNIIYIPKKKQSSRAAVFYKRNAAVFFLGSGLTVDGFAADVVRDIFRWKLEGTSAADIAGRLNRDGILPPMEYKKQQGMRFATPFHINAHFVWNPTAVLRILKNSVYKGVLEQDYPVCFCAYRKVSAGRFQCIRSLGYADSLGSFVRGDSSCGWYADPFSCGQEEGQGVFEKAVAITIFGTTSPAALATTVGVLTEVPVMLFLVKIANNTKGCFKNGLINRQKIY